MINGNTVSSGRLVGDMFDGEGFGRGLRDKGFVLQGADALVVGAGGVGSLGLFDSEQAEPEPIVGEGVMKRERTAFVEAASARGFRVQVGTDMLFEHIRVCPAFFGLPNTTLQWLRSLSRWGARSSVRKQMQTAIHAAPPGALARSCVAG